MAELFFLLLVLVIFSVVYNLSFSSSSSSWPGSLLSACRPELQVVSFTGHHEERRQGGAQVSRDPI
ncbi:hypothetical protein E2C01_096656 [Portunus trituberculatus]|uniref:Secreted protein n=1 Tax=Portunus trituberculatus TaxID=210409 RepID=A0A5B7JW78_PORTR|nr:hypothetical protein [Portunus trituberculatus]